MRTAPVTVVIPCFCCVGTIERAVESVRRQTMVPAELILVDDASRDGTLEHLERIRALSAPGWVRVLEHDVNAGPGVARNTAWNAASQPYLAFLDADDIWHSRKIEVQFEWMDRHPDVALTGHLTAVAGNTGAVDRELPSSIDAEVVSRSRLLLSNCFPTRSVMVRTAIPNRFPAAKRYSEDYELWLALAYSGHELHRLMAPLAFSFKEDFGATGLTSKLWRMEHGELQALHRLLEEKRIGSFRWTAATTWSLAKFARRVAVTAMRRLRS